jgi:hypothetical protein
MRSSDIEQFRRRHSLYRHGYNERQKNLTKNVVYIIAYKLLNRVRYKAPRPYRAEIKRTTPLGAQDAI